jgi:hypothetical protein
MINVKMKKSQVFFVRLGTFEQTITFGSRSFYGAKSLSLIIIMPEATIIKLVPSYFMPVFVINAKRRKCKMQNAKCKMKEKIQS